MATEPEPPRTLAGKIKDHVGWWLAAVAAIAGVVGLYFAINPPDPPGPTMSEWRIAALSVCSEYGGDGVTKFDRANKSQQRLDDDAQQGKTPDESAVKTTGQQWEEAGNAIADFVGNIRKIKQPPDHAKQINEALDLGDDIATTMASAGRAIHDQGAEGGRRGLDWIDANASLWREKMAKLGLCSGNTTFPSRPSS
ncbi:hypothetical protein ACFW7J_26405 [Streptomyces sp. NPDC059525]|uniref:hypothetical protein n=1 Tax=Streptomyces sp. NPDC059525 TaxID=3346857 RepID=UPI0036A14240